MPIRLRLGLAFAAVTGVLVVVGGLLFLHSFERGVESSLDPGLRSKAAELRQDVRAGVVTAALQGTNGSALHGRDEVAQVLTPGGRLIATTGEAGARALIPTSQLHATGDGDVLTKAEILDEQEPFRVLATRASTEHGDRVILVATSLESSEAAVDRVERALVVGGTLAVLLAGLGGIGLAWAALRPVERLRNEAADISEHDADARLQVPRTRDEIAALATTMNSLLERLHAALGRERAFVADAGHELRTPLGVLRTELELAMRPQRSRAELEDAIQHAAGETERLTGLAEELLLLASTYEGHHALVAEEDVVAIVERAVGGARPRADAQGVRLVVDASGPVPVPVIGDLARRAIDNLLDNALRYSPGGSAVHVHVDATGELAVVQVSDEGPGFPPEFLPHAFERFRRADDARSRAEGGAGLGLAIVEAIVGTHGGSVDAATHDPHGATVTLRFPRHVNAHMSDSRPS